MRSAFAAALAVRGAAPLCGSAAAVTVARSCAKKMRASCAPVCASFCVSDVFYAIIIMLKMESVCTFCWRAWCWSLDQDQTCCVLARLSCTGHPMKACDARTSPRPCGHEYNSTYALSFVVGVVPVLHMLHSVSYITSGLLPDACSATRNSWEIFRKMFSEAVRYNVMDRICFL